MRAAARSLMARPSSSGSAAVGPLFAGFADAELTLLRDFLRTSNEFYATQIDRVERLSR
jgi:hypothetical protein